MSGIIQGLYLFGAFVALWPAYEWLAGRLIAAYPSQPLEPHEVITCVLLACFVAAGWPLAGLLRASQSLQAADNGSDAGARSATSDRSGNE